MTDDTLKCVQDTLQDPVVPTVASMATVRQNRCFVEHIMPWKKWEGGGERAELMPNTSINRPFRQTLCLRSQAPSFVSIVGMGPGCLTQLYSISPGSLALLWETVGDHSLNGETCLLRGKMCCGANSFVSAQLERRQERLTMQEINALCLVCAGLEETFSNARCGGESTSALIARRN